MYGMNTYTTPNFSGKDEKLLWRRQIPLYDELRGRSSASLVPVRVRTRKSSKMGLDAIQPIDFMKFIFEKNIECAPLVVHNRDPQSQRFYP